jgi:hypothetical protein
MRPEAEPPPWASECCAMIVGVAPSCRTVGRVYLWRDGRMASPDRIHRLRLGTPAWNEAEDVFGLSRAHLFAMDEDSVILANIYAFRLERDLAASVAISQAP